MAEIYEVRALLEAALVRRFAQQASDADIAALRRIYTKAGLSALPAHAKRRALCRVARQRGWI